MKALLIRPNYLTAEEEPSPCRHEDRPPIMQSDVMAPHVMHEMQPGPMPPTMTRCWPTQGPPAHALSPGLDLPHGPVR